MLLKKCWKKELLPSGKNPILFSSQTTTHKTTMFKTKQFQTLKHPIWTLRELLQTNQGLHNKLIWDQVCTLNYFKLSLPFPLNHFQHALLKTIFGI